MLCVYDVMLDVKCGICVCVMCLCSLLFFFFPSSFFFFFLLGIFNF